MPSWRLTTVEFISEAWPPRPPV